MFSPDDIRKTAKNDEPICDPCSRPQKQRELLPQGLIVVVNEIGLAEYRRVKPDGHLGALED